MSLNAIVRALGGELYDGGRRAVVPGPGHSPRDRSVSLLVSNGRLVVHSFGRSSWREVVDDLRRRGLIDASTPSSRQADAPIERGRTASIAARVAVAARLWSEASPLVRQLSMTHIRLRGIDRDAPVSLALRHHGHVPSAVYADRGAPRPALLAAVTNVAGDLCAVEITYLAADGRRESDLALSRKTIGALPRSSAVRLDPFHDELSSGKGCSRPSRPARASAWRAGHCSQPPTFAPGPRQRGCAGSSSQPTGDWRGSDPRDGFTGALSTPVSGRRSLGRSRPQATGTRRCRGEGRGGRGRVVEARDKPGVDAGASS